MIQILENIIKINNNQKMASFNEKVVVFLREHILVFDVSFLKSDKNFCLFFLI